MLDGEDVKFSYKLLEGPADSRNAIRLLRALGYDPGIADRAEERAKRFMETGNWEL
jgi:DNA mismatch repair ATPase MutS